MLRTHRDLLLTLFFFVFCPLFANATGMVYRFQDQNGKGQVNFFSEAPVENIDGDAGGLTGMVYFDPQIMFLSGYVSTTVESMRTGLAMRDDHMRSKDWLDGAKFPTIGFKLLPMEKTAFHKDKENVWSVRAKGLFTLKGVSKEISAPMQLTMSNNKLIAAGQFMVSLADFGIKGPAAMNFIGARVGENVRVKLNLVGTQSNEVAPSSMLPQVAAPPPVARHPVKKKTVTKKKHHTTVRKKYVQ